MSKRAEVRATVFQSATTRFEREEARDRHAPVSLGEVVEFCTRLCGAGAIQSGANEGTLIVTGAEARLFDTRPIKAWRGHAERLHGDGRGSVWRVQIFAGPTGTIAAATLSLDQDAAVQPRTVSVEPDSFTEAPNGQNKNEHASARRRAQIAAAACDAIARKGFANATMREIARAAGLHVPTMYQYVTSKDEMLELVYRWIMESVRTDVIEAAGPHWSATEKLRAVVAAMINRGDKFRSRIGVLNRELKSLSPQARRRVLDEYRALLDQIAALIEDGVKAGEFRPVHPVIAANLVDAICDIWPLRPFAVGSLDHVAFTKEVLDFVFAGLRRAKS